MFPSHDREQAKKAEDLKKKELAEKQRKIKEAEEKARKLQAEIDRKKAEEAQKEADRLAAVEAEAKKGDADKIQDLITDLQALKTKYKFKSKTNQSTYTNVAGLLDKIVGYIQEKV